MFGSNVFYFYTNVASRNEVVIDLLFMQSNRFYLNICRIYNFSYNSVTCCQNLPTSAAMIKVFFDGEVFTFEVPVLEK